MKACLQPYTCLNERRRVFAFPPAFTWNNPCISCMEGIARQMDKFVPEKDTMPLPPQTRRESKDIPIPICSVCGKRITTGADKCRSCFNESRLPCGYATKKTSPRGVSG